MNDSMYDALALPFPQKVERQLKKGGTTLTYIPISEVINRMNRVVGLANWDTEVVSVGRDGVDPDYVVAHVVVTVRIDGETTVKAGFGGTKLKRTRAGEIVDLGDDYKGAVSDAIKKALQQLGVGLYLARADEALRMDEELYAAPDPEREEVAQMWTAFMDHMKTMDDAGKQHVADFWASAYEGEPKPHADTVTKQQVLDLIGAVMAYKFDAEIVEDPS